MSFHGFYAGDLKAVQSVIAPPSLLLKYAYIFEFAAARCQISATHAIYFIILSILSRKNGKTWKRLLLLLYKDFFNVKIIQLRYDFIQLRYKIIQLRYKIIQLRYKKSLHRSPKNDRARCIQNDRTRCTRVNACYYCV